MDSPEMFLRREILCRGYKFKYVAQKAGIEYSKLMPSLNGRRELRADEYLACCAVIGADPRGIQSARGSE